MATFEIAISLSVILVKQGKSPKNEVMHMPHVTAVSFFFSDHRAVRMRKWPKKQHASSYFARVLRRLPDCCLKNIFGSASLEASYPFQSCSMSCLVTPLCV